MSFESPQDQIADLIKRAYSTGQQSGRNGWDYLSDEDQITNLRQDADNITERWRHLEWLARDHVWSEVPETFQNLSEWFGSDDDDE